MGAAVITCTRGGRVVGREARARQVDAEQRVALQQLRRQAFERVVLQEEGLEIGPREDATEAKGRGLDRLQLVAAHPREGQGR